MAVQAGRGTRRRAPHRPRRGRGNGRRPASPACRCRGAAPRAGRPAGPAGAHRRLAACGPRGPRPGPCSGRCRAAPRAPAEIGASRPVSPSSRRPTDGRGAAEQLVELGGDPLAREVARPARPVPDPGQRLRLQLESERRRQPDGADHPQGVLLEARRRSRRPRGGPVRRRRHRPPYGSTSAGRLSRARGAPGHRVDGEVAAGEVELDRVAELDPVRSPEVGVVVVGPEGRDLEDRRRRAGRRPSRTGSRRRRRERARRAGPAVRRRRGPSRPAVARERRRATSRRRRTPRGPLTRASRAGRGRAGGIGAARRRTARPVSCDPGTGTSARPRCARRRGTA